MHRGIRFVADSDGAAAVAARSFTQRPYAREELRFNAERPLRNERLRANSQLFLSTEALLAGIHVRNESQFPHPPSYPCQDGTGPPQTVRSRPSLGPRPIRGPYPWGLKLGSLLTTLAVFAGSFGYASSNAFVTNAPLKPATVASVATTTSTTSTTTTTPTTTLTPSVRATSRPAVTRTASS